jgi:DnaJ domain
MRDRYPLSWPAGWKREQSPQWSRFKPGSAYAEGWDVEHQLKMLGATDVIITSNMQYRADGLPYARQSISDTGVAVYFKHDGEEQCIPCDKWVKVEENLRAIAKTIEAIRGLERWGAKDMVNAAFRGFKALPGGIVTPPPKQDWWIVLDVNPGANAHEVKAAYRDAIKLHHPDAGGKQEDFTAIQQAYEDWKNS